VITAKDIAAALTGAIVKDPVADEKVWREYLDTVVRSRAKWRDLYEAVLEFRNEE
jgi:hypothetical protein